VEDVYEKENAERNRLAGQVVELQKQAQKIGEDAVSLAQALKGNTKSQGNWGEVVLERLLEQSGLQKGREYDTQVSFAGEDGSRRMPDVIVHLPEEKDIIIDAKSGVTGAGRSAKESSLFSEVSEGLHAYGVSTHRHTPEIEQGLREAAGRPVEVTFTPHLVPMNRGILATL
jgi:DNA recombination protein RmuC